MAEAILKKKSKSVAGGISCKITYTDAGTFNSPYYELSVPSILSATSYKYSFNELGTGTTTPGSTLQQTVAFTGYLEIIENLTEV